MTKLQAYKNSQLTNLQKYKSQKVALKKATEAARIVPNMELIKVLENEATDKQMAKLAAIRTELRSISYCSITYNNLATAIEHINAAINQLYSSRN